ncbi:Methylmalonyl-CoA epimerase [Candidatus Zixiibacteriota bacterium]|nr:Methylmalonyl-CoA epimerase [candidate division Zixibacteria bacterium]
MTRRPGVNKSMIAFSHAAIAVRDLDESIRLYTELLGAPPRLVRDLPEQKIKLALFKTASGNIELIASSDSASPIQKFVNDRGGGLHHISLKVPDIDRKLEELKSKGFRLVDQIPRIGAEGHKIAFVHPSSFSNVLIELEEE